MRRPADLYESDEAFIYAICRVPPLPNSSQLTSGVIEPASLATTSSGSPAVPIALWRRFFLAGFALTTLDFKFVVWEVVVTVLY